MNKVLTLMIRFYMLFLIIFHSISFSSLVDLLAIAGLVDGSLIYFIYFIMFSKKNMKIINYY